MALSKFTKDLFNRKLHFLCCVCKSEEVLIDRMGQEHLFHCSNLVVNGCFWISNPHNYHILLKRGQTVQVPKLIDIIMT